MGLFGSRSPEKQRMAWDEKPMQLPDADIMTPALQDTPVLGGMIDRAPVAAMPQKQGINWAGIVSDVFGGLAGQGPQWAIAQAQQKAREREMSLEDVRWNRRQQWEQEHPAPRYFEANNGDQMVVGADGQPRTVYKDPTPKTNWVAVDDGKGGKQLIPFVNGVPMGQGQMNPQGPAPSGNMPHPQAIARLRANPAEAAQFDEIFGPGTAARILGGAGSQGPATFP